MGSASGRTQQRRRGIAVVAATLLLLSMNGSPPTHADPNTRVCSENGDFTTIGDAVEAAGPGDTITVCPGTYEEAVEVDVPDLTLLSEERREAQINASGLGAPALTITADGVTAEEFVAVSSSGVGIAVEADDATLRGFFVVTSGDDPVIGIEGVLPGVSGLTVEDTVIRPGGFSEASPAIIGEDGIRGRLFGAEIRDNNIAGFAGGVRLRPHGDDNLVDGNTFGFVNTGVVTWSPNTRIEANTFFAINRGVDIAIPPGEVAEGNVLRANDLSEIVGPFTPRLRLRGPDQDGTVTDVEVDARQNDWGHYTREDVSESIANLGVDTTVDITCFLDPDGEEICPPIPFIEQPREGQTVRENVHVAGFRAEPDAQVTIRDADTGDALATTTAAGDGQWQVLLEALPEGEHAITAEGEKIDGNGVVTRSEPSPPRTFTVDMTGQVTLEEPADGTFTNNPTPLVWGTADPDIPLVTLRIYAGDAPVGDPIEELEAERDREWWWVQLTNDQSLDEGTYTAQAEQTGTLSNANTFHIKTTPPQITLDEPADGATTTDPQPTFSGTAGTAPGDGNEVRVLVHEGETTAGRVALGLTTTRDPDTGAWSVTPTGPMADGIYTAQAHQRDEAENLGSSDAHTFRIKTTPPAVSIREPADGSFTTRVTLAWGEAGTAPGDLPDVTVRLFAGDEPTGTPLLEETAERDGPWWFIDGIDPSLTDPDGTYTLQAEQTDELGNVGLAQSTFVVDTVPPQVEILTPDDGETLLPLFVTVTGEATDDNAVSRVELTYTHQLTGFEEEATVSCAGAECSWSHGPTIPSLLPGQWEVEAVAVDVAGNRSDPDTITFATLTDLF